MSSDSIKQSKPKYLGLRYLLCLLFIISYTVLWYTDCIVIKVAGEIGNILTISKTSSFREISGDFLSLVFTAVSVISVIMLLLSLLLRKTEKLTFINLSLVCDIISLILFVFINTFLNFCGCSKYRLHLFLPLSVPDILCNYYIKYKENSIQIIIEINIWFLWGNNNSQTPKNNKTQKEMLTPSAVCWIIFYRRVL